MLEVHLSEDGQDRRALQTLLQPTGLQVFAVLDLFVFKDETVGQFLPTSQNSHTSDEPTGDAEQLLRRLRFVRLTSVQVETSEFLQRRTKMRF